jgi:DNA-binding SARP family transcriptional activator
MVSQGKTSICLFGVYPIRINGEPCYLGISGATQMLFQYLLLAVGKEIRRELLAEIFWSRSSAERQRSALNSAIWRIKHQLTEIRDIDLVCNGPTIFLQVAPNVSNDAKELLQIVNAISPNEPLDERIVERLCLALNNCDAPFMEGVTSDWVLTEREKMFNIKIRGMTMLMHWRGEQRRYEDALEIGRRLLVEDPFREAVQCEVMWLYVLNGQRAQALRQYKEYCELLRDELDIDPMPETLALYNHIRRDLNCAGRKLKMEQSSSGATPIKLNLLLRVIEQSRRDLYRTIRAQLG